MFKVIVYIGRVLSPITVALLMFEWLFSLLPANGTANGILGLLIVFLIGPILLILMTKLFFKVLEIQQDKLGKKIPHSKNYMFWVRANLVIMQVFILLFVIICINLFNYPFRGERAPQIFMTILVITAFIVAFRYEKYFYFYDHKDDPEVRVVIVDDATNYIFHYIGTQDDVNQKISEFVHNFDYGLDADERIHGLFYSHFDRKSVQESCFAYYFHDGKIVEIKCWMKNCRKYYSMQHIFRRYKDNVFRLSELKKFEHLVNLLRRGY